MAPVATYQGKAPKIRWNTADQFGLGGGASTVYGSCSAGALVTSEAWAAYVDIPDMRAPGNWPVSQTCAAGSQQGGFGGDALVMTVQFGCGLGSGAGFAYHEHTFAVPDGSYRVEVPFSIDESPGFLNMGVRVQGVTLAASSDTTFIACVNAVGGGGITVQLGAFDLEWGMSPRTLTFELVEIFGAVAGDETPGGEGEEPGVGDWCELRFGFPLFGARSWPAPGPTSQREQFASGEEDAWIDELAQYLEGEVRYIPAHDTTTSYGPATGWNSPCGWQRFLEWARRGNVFEFWRDANDAGSALDCVLESPIDDEPDIDSGIYRRLTLRVRTADNAALTGY
jgi:hypothetical protein